jgi:outer membrane protein OmpA-like peptidoglycan-associated protein
MTRLLRRARGAAMTALIPLMLLATMSSAQTLRDTLFAEADVAQAAAIEANAALLAPRNYQRAAKAYATAEEYLEAGRNIETVRSRLADATEYYTAAAEAADLARLTLASVLKTREDALKAEAAVLSKPIWDDAQEKFADAVSVLERGDLGRGKRYAIEAESLYRDAELGAIKTKYLSETRRLLADADRARVSRYAPQTLERSKELLQQAEKELNENRYDTDLPRNLAQQANYEARHAIYLAEVVRRVRDKDLTVEELILDWEKALGEVADAADIVPDMATGGENLSARLTEYVTSLRERNQVLTRDYEESELRVREMSEEIRLLDDKLGGATAERQALMQRLQQQALIREKFERVEALFSRDEALVFREGNVITMRMVGLTFGSGKSTVESQYYPLLEKVETAIDTFPRSQIVIEGHTDSYGGDEANMRLSKARAEAVMQYMVNAMRIPTSRLTATGFGETQPIANNETAAGRARNRRIDIVIRPDLEL